MNVEQAYDQWSGQYDTNVNRTRDLEAVSLRETLAGRGFRDCLEVGCGTGKNSQWLIEHTEHLHAFDLSEEMMALARQKLAGRNVTFSKGDITREDDLLRGPYDLVVFSLVLEHVDDVSAVIHKVAGRMASGGLLYVGELHPFKQYNGSKARFQADGGEQVVTCFNHHVTDFTGAAASAGLQLLELKEYFDDNDRNQVPRILTLLFQKP